MIKVKCIKRIEEGYAIPSLIGLGYSVNLLNKIYNEIDKTNIKSKSIESFVDEFEEYKEFSKKVN